VGGVGWDTWPQMLLSSSENKSDVGEGVRVCDEVSWLMWWWS